MSDYIPCNIFILKFSLFLQEKVDVVLDTEGAQMLSLLNESAPEKLKNLTRTIASVVDDYMLVSFVTLDVSDEDSINTVLLHIDHALQYGEDLDLKQPDDEFPPDD